MGAGVIRGFVMTAVLAVAGIVGACSTPKPYVSVVSAHPVADRELVLLVEIHNPSGSPIQLESLDYDLARPGQVARSRGRIAVRETVSPGHTAVVDIRVPLGKAAVPGEVFDLSGRLHGHAGDLALSWGIKAAPQVQAAQ
jgi:LEA14-like dessication related protein